MIIREIQNKLCRGENRTNNADEPRQPMEYAGETKIFISGFECIATDMPYPALCTTAIDNEVFNKSKNCEFCIFRRVVRTRDVAVYEQKICVIAI